MSPADFEAVGLSIALESSIAIITFDQPNSPVNVLSSAVAAAFSVLFDVIENGTQYTGAVLISGKRDTWIAGADIEELSSLKTPLQGEELSRTGHAVMNKLAGMKKPMVAGDSRCGAGRWVGSSARMPSSHRQRSSQVDPGTPRSAAWADSGRWRNAASSAHCGAAGRVGHDSHRQEPFVRRRHCKWGWCTKSCIRQSCAELPFSVRNSWRKAKRFPRANASKAPRIFCWKTIRWGARLCFVRHARRSSRKRKAISPLRSRPLKWCTKAIPTDSRQGWPRKARKFGDLAVSAVCKQLVYLFFATTALKRDTGVPANVQATALPVRKLGILGAGFMGAGIASVAVQQGTLVRIKDASTERLGKGYAAVRDVVRERLKKRQITRVQFDDTMSLVGSTVDYSGFANVDLVIEAVFEDINVKHAVLHEIESAAPHAIFASNTSTIPIHDIASVAQHPDRVLGMHFFSPVHKMPLLEVIITAETSAQTTVTAVEYGKRLGKTVIVVHDGPGFFVNRVLAPYLNESGKLLDDGATIEAVDSAMTQFGFPVGPFTLLDEVGLDIAGKSGAILTQAFGDRMQPSVTLQRIIADGRLGRKSRKGFYQYDEDGKRQGVSSNVYAMSPAGETRKEFDKFAMQRRAILPLLNEAVRCLEEGIIASPRDGDIGAVFGIGFPTVSGRSVSLHGYRRSRRSGTRNWTN